MFLQQATDQTRGSIVQIRRAEVTDVDALARLRIAFLQEVGDLLEEQAPSLLEVTREYFARTVPTEQFIAFVAEEAGQIVATSGLIFFERPPSERDPRGKEGYVLNMYTCPDWRSQGIATTLLRELIAYAAGTGVKRLVLHATPAAQRLYERAGFVPRAGDMQLRL